MVFGNSFINILTVLHKILIFIFDEGVVMNAVFGRAFASSKPHPVYMNYFLHFSLESIFTELFFYIITGFSSHLRLKLIFVTRFFSSGIYE